jgi:hypothetical protein
MIVGQKVVCVDDKFPPAVQQLYTALPVKDSVYVIRNVLIGLNWKSEPGEVCLYLVGLNNPRSSKPPFPERGFNSERFRPLEEVQQRQTDSHVMASGVEMPSQIPVETA